MLEKDPPTRYAGRFLCLARHNIEIRGSSDRAESFQKTSLCTGRMLVSNKDVEKYEHS